MPNVIRWHLLVFKINLWEHSDDYSRNNGTNNKRPTTITVILLTIIADITTTDGSNSNDNRRGFFLFDDNDYWTKMNSSIPIWFWIKHKTNVRTISKPPILYNFQWEIDYIYKENSKQAYGCLHEWNWKQKRMFFSESTKAEQYTISDIFVNCLREKSGFSSL